MIIINYCVCSCGAVTVFMNGENYSVLEQNFETYFPNIDLAEYESKKLQNFNQCNHCINHWGLDLCSCGSGKNFDECDGGFDYCGKPMQVLGEYSNVSAEGAWG